MTGPREGTQVRKRAAVVLRAAGWRNDEICIALRMSSPRVSQYLSDSGIPLPKIPDDRAEEMEVMYRAGRTLEEIGREFSISRERARQILTAHDVASKDAGWRAIKKAEASRKLQERWTLRGAKRDQHCDKYYGCSYAETQAINGGRNFTDAGSPVQKFIRQRQSAEQRRIRWNITLPQWWSIWQESGKWELMGRGREGYCMARRGDVGAYELGNVEIISSLQNIKDSYVSKPRKHPRDELGLTKAERRIYDLLRLGITSPTAIGAALGVQSATVGQYLLRLRAQFPDLPQAKHKRLAIESAPMRAAL